MTSAVVLIFNRVNDRATTPGQIDQLKINPKYDVHTLT